MKATKRIVACFIIALGLVTAPICVDAKIKARAEKEVGTKELLQRLFNAGISMSPGKAQGQIERQRALDAIILSRIFSKDGIIDADAVSQLLWTRASAKYASVAEIYRLRYCGGVFAESACSQERSKVSASAGDCMPILTLVTRIKSLEAA